MSLALASFLCVAVPLYLPAAIFWAQTEYLDAGTVKQSEPAKSLDPALANASHRFWNKTNLALFTGTAAARALDYTSTRQFRSRGIDERLLTNGIVDNKPLFVGLETAATAASIAVSYWLHKEGHHRLERWVSMTHIGVAAFGDIHNYRLGHSQAGPRAPAGFR